ncbi:LysR substrate-binding domain-containing protein [Ruania zhangjianzhongii]|uniref:LysR substrate-binding domain-containing protein n=1 Tax=Ruania zhangjianzhongii TaxID=2603206 RepID=UPI0011C9BF93|nr:LysR substrate-binding domain-containing protein [Ruania zhangjianzhongii]
MPVAPFRLGYVPGVTPAKWVRTWTERHQLPLELVPLTAPTAAAALTEGTVDAALLRPPVDSETVSAIPLYTEVTVVVAAKDHALAALEAEEEATAADLAGDVLLHPLDDVYPDTSHLPATVLDHRPATTADAIELAAAGTGLLIVPMSLARLYHRRDLLYRTLAGAPGAPVLLAWLTEQTTDAVEDFIGIVRGRTVNSTRGRRLEPEADPSDQSGRDSGAPSARGGSAARARPGQGGGPAKGAYRRRPSSARGQRPGSRRRGRR